jgi:hypothetical protein
MRDRRNRGTERGGDSHEAPPRRRDDLRRFERFPNSNISRVDRSVKPSDGVRGPIF